MFRIGVALLFFPVLAPAQTPYAQQIAKFRAEREQAIKKDWLPLVGLYWLKEGENRLGSAETADVPLPASLPASVGTFTFSKGYVYFRPSGPSVLNLKNAGPAVEGEVTDQVFTSGTVEFFLIRRDERAAVRVKDYAAPELETFKHLNWAAVDPTWNLTAKFTPWDKPHKLTYDTVIPGLREEFSSPGYVTFTRNKVEYRLEPVEEDGEFFYVFRDRSSGKTTYAAARYVYSEKPVNGTVKLDFNKATNPPCAFTSFATCPLPPPQNRLQLEVTAGELMYHKK
jgi:uncharacterized protein (DUF1684 family)